MGDRREVVRRRRLSRADVEGLIRDFEQSGLTRKAFCEARGIAVHTLDYYRHRERSRRGAPAGGELLPVELMDGTPPGSGLRVELANGRRILVEAGFDVLQLKRLLAVLEG